MVYISSFLFVALLAILAFYRFIYPRKKISYLKLTFLFSLLPLWTLLRPGSHESGDLTLHTTRFVSFFNSVSEGNILPQWSGDLNAGYGEPVFIFVQTLPYHISSLFHIIGFSFIDSLKLLFAVSFVLSGIFMYLWAREEFGEKGGFAASLLYLFAPYHLVDMHFRGNPGETLAFTLPPLSLLAIKKIFDGDKDLWVVIGAISTALLILAHPVAIVTFPFIVFYSIFLFFEKGKKFKSIIKSFISFALGISLSAYYWLPEIVESKYTHQAYYHSSVIYQSLQDFIYSPWRFGLLFQGPQGELSFLIGYVQLFLFIFGFILLLNKTFNKKEARFFLLLSLILIFSIFMMLPHSKFIWESFPIIKNLQFSYRIMVLVALLVSLIGGLVVKKIKSDHIFTLICLLIIGTTILNWGNRRNVVEVNDSYIIANLPSASYEYEGSAPSAPVWTDPKSVWVKDIPKSYLEVIDGNAKIKQLSRNSTTHIYQVEADKTVYLKENNLYFPGWNVYLNGNKIKINYENKMFPGLITFTLPEGNHTVEVIFENTPIRTLSQQVSLFSIFLILLYLLKKAFDRKLAL